MQYSFSTHDYLIISSWNLKFGYEYEHFECREFFQGTFIAVQFYLLEQKLL